MNQLWTGSCAANLYKKSFSMLQTQGDESSPSMNGGAGGCLTGSAWDFIFTK